MSLIILIMVAPLALMVGCGIGAVHTASKQFGMKRNLKQAQKLFKGLTSRGNHASGFAWTTTSGLNPNTGKPLKYSGMWIVKRPVSANALSHRMKPLLDSNTRILLMHTRYPTDGANNETNAHPHRSPQTQRITLVHNGMVFSHKKVFEDIGVKPKTQCDSEAIAACLEEGGIESVVKHVYGSMALLWVDDNEPHVLNAWHNDGNPLFFSRLDNQHGPIVWASTEDHLKKAYGKRLHNVLEATVGKHYKVYPDGRMESEHIIGSHNTYYDYKYNSRSYQSTGELSTKVKTSKRGHTTLRSQVPTEVERHSYDEMTHEGIRPDGSRYVLPSSVDPITDQLDAIDVKDGEYDPYNFNSQLYNGGGWGDSFDFQ